MSKPEVVSEIFCVIKHYQQPNEPDLMLTPQVLTEWAKNPPDVAAGGGLKRKKLLMTVRQISSRISMRLTISCKYNFRW